MTVQRKMRQNILTGLRVMSGQCKDNNKNCSGTNERMGLNPNRSLDRYSTIRT